MQMGLAEALTCSLWSKVMCCLQVLTTKQWARMRDVTMSAETEPWEKSPWHLKAGKLDIRAEGTNQKHKDTCSDCYADSSKLRSYLLWKFVFFLHNSVCILQRYYCATYIAELTVLMYFPPFSQSLNSESLFSLQINKTQVQPWLKAFVPNSYCSN